MRTKIFLAAALLLACEPDDPYTCGFEIELDAVPIWINSGCTADDIEIIAGAVNELNDTTEQIIGTTFLVVSGTTDDDGLFAVRCHYTEPEWYAGSEYEGTIAYADGTGIEIFVFRNPEMSVNYKTAIILHELGHIAGVGHSEDNASIMFPDIDPLHDEYTHVDHIEFCANFSQKGQHS